MKRGLPKSIIKKYGITKKAWRVYRGGKKGSKKKRGSSRKRKTGGRKTARNFKIPLAVLGGVVGGVGRRAPSGRTLLGDVVDGNWDNLMYDAREILAGIDAGGKFRPEWIVATYLPMIIGGLVHKYVGGRAGLNINQYLRGIPLISI